MYTRYLTICLITLTMTGCSYVRSSQHMDIKPFAESTINLVSEINYGLDANQAVYLRRYVSGAPASEYRAHWDYYRPVLRGIGIYSLGLVTISRSNLSNSEQAAQVGELLDKIFKAALTTSERRLNLSNDQIDAILADVRAQKTLLNAIQAAQPVVDEVARFSSEYLDIIKDSQDQLQEWLIQQIDADHAAVLAFNERAKVGQQLNLNALSLLADYRQGRDDQALVKLRQIDAEFADMLPEGQKPDVESLKRLEDRIVDRLARLQNLKEQFAFDLDNYRDMTGELDQLVKGANDNLRRTRLTIFVWSAAHRRLAAGITDPARIDLMGVAKRALDAAVPL